MKNWLLSSETVASQVDHDSKLFIYALVCMVIYMVIFLGGCSPIHCRLVVIISGMLMIVLSIYVGNLLGFLLGFRMNYAHYAIPALMIGIGVDDMFVICSSLDQLSLKLSPGERMKQALKHSGPSITITSFTNALAFLGGANSQLVAIQSFCIYSSVTILVLYLCVLTLFLPVLYWDAERINTKKGEFCGLFSCKEDSILFCKGKFLTD